MLLDVDEIKVEQNVADEWGIYRVYKKSGNTQPRKFLLFSCTERQEALYYADRIASVLPKVMFRGERFSTPYNLSDGQEGENPSETAAEKVISPNTTSNTKPKPKQYPRVTGAGDIIKIQVNKGATDEQIIEELLPLYKATGRPHDNAVDTIKASIYTVRNS
jgi:hypothetical protein